MLNKLGWVWPHSKLSFSSTTRVKFFPKIWSRQYQAVSVSISQYQSVSGSIRQYQAVSGSIIRLYQSVSGCIRLYEAVSGHIIYQQSINTAFKQLRWCGVKAHNNATLWPWLTAEAGQVFNWSWSCQSGPSVAIIISLFQFQ